MTLETINLNTEEGKFLLASMCIISTTFRTDKTVYEIFDEVEELRNKMYDDEKINEDMSFENLDKELDELDEIEFYRVVEAKMSLLRKLRQEPIDLDLLNDEQLMEKFNDKIFGHYYRQIFESRQRFRSEVCEINRQMKDVAKEEMKKILK